MDIFINWDNDSKSIQIPILPESFMLEDTMNNTTLTIHNLGDINLKGKRGLYILAFESFFPSQDYDFARCQFKDPYEHYIKKLKKLFEDNETLHLIITETNINSHFTIDSFSYGHDEKTKDVRYSLSFTEYRTIKSTSAGTAKARASKAVKSQTVTWKKGDTWQKVTKKVLGSSSTYKTQKKNNKAVINKAMKKHPKLKEKDALVGYKVVVKP